MIVAELYARPSWKRDWLPLTMRLDRIRAACGQRGGLLRRRAQRLFIETRLNSGNVRSGGVDIARLVCLRIGGPVLECHEHVVVAEVVTKKRK